VFVFTAAVIFVLIVSIDLFACGLAYGASKVRVPFTKVLAINLVGKVMVGASLFAGYYLGELVPTAVGIWLGFSVLVTVGIVKVIQWYLTRNKPFTPNANGISWYEAIILGIVLSLDGDAMAFGATMTDMPMMFIFAVLGIALISDQVVFLASQYLGGKFTKKANLNLGWLSGVIIIAVATAKLFFELFT